MNSDYLSVDQISEKLGIHPKTIQRYIREGKLRAVKIGKSWRVSANDLRAFLDAGSIQSEEAKAPVTGSSVVDIEVQDEQDALRISNTLSAALISKPPEFAKSSVHSQYNESQRTVRVALWGDIRFISSILDMISTITGRDN